MYVVKIKTEKGAHVSFEKTIERASKTLGLWVGDGNVWGGLISAQLLPVVAGEVSMADCEAGGVNKGELAAGVIPAGVYDLSLPQRWLDQFRGDDYHAYHAIRWGVVWLYAAGDPFGGPFALTKDAADILAKTNN